MIYVVPASSEGFNNFRYTYLKGGGQQMRGDNTDVYRQINDNEFLCVNSFNAQSKVAFNFALEKFDKEKLVSKVTPAE
jgi:lipopolysaccharide export system permease protein